MKTTHDGIKIEGPEWRCRGDEFDGYHLRFSKDGLSVIYRMLDDETLKSSIIRLLPFARKLLSAINSNQTEN